MKKHLARPHSLIPLMSIIGLGLLILIQEWDQRPSKVSIPWYEGHGRMPNSFRQQLPRLHKLQFRQNLPESYLPAITKQEN